MHLNRRFLCACAGVTASLLLGQHAVTCEDIAILSSDARFLVLSGDTLTEKDVGNLWWLGIRGVDSVISQSTLARAGILSDSHVGPALSAQPATETALTVLPDLGRFRDSPKDLAALTLTDVSNVRWVDDSLDGPLIVSRWVDGQHVLTFYGSDLGVQADLTIGAVNLALGIGCRDQGRTLVAGLKHRAVIQDGMLISMGPLPQPSSPGDPRLLPLPTVNCVGLMVDFAALSREEDPNSASVTLWTIDLRTNKLGPALRGKRFAARVLFGGGARLLEQDLFATSTGEAGYRVTPTGHLRVLDTRNGSVLHSTDLGSSGEISRLLCRDESERVVLAERNELRLIDLTSLIVVASRAVPFERYFVF